MALDGRLLSGAGVFVAVVEAGSFVRAADALGLTQSGVSRAVARLEARVGVRLLNRTPRAIALTDEGRRFHAEIVPLLAGLEEAAASAAGSAATVRGRLRINADPWFAKLALVPRLGYFLERYPELTLDLSVRDDGGDLVGDGFDVAVRFGEPPASSLVARKLLDTRVLTCASPAYLSAHGTPKHPDDLARHACLLFRDPMTGRPFPWEFHRGTEIVAVKVSGRVTFNDLATTLAAATAGLGIAQCFALGLEPWLRNDGLVPVLEDWAEERFPLYAYYPSRRLPPAKVRAFLDFVRDGSVQAM